MLTVTAETKYTRPALFRAVVDSFSPDLIPEEGPVRVVGRLAFARVVALDGEGRFKVRDDRLVTRPSFRFLRGAI